MAILSIGTRLEASVKAALAMEDNDPTLGVTVADARWMKPLDTKLIAELADNHDVLVTVEEGSIGGFGDHVLHFLALGGYLDNGNLKVRPMVIPDKYIETGSMDQQYEEAGLSESFIAATALKLLGKESLSASMKFAPPPESGEAQIA